MTHTQYATGTHYGSAGGAKKPSHPVQILTKLGMHFSALFMLWYNRRAMFKLSRLEDRILADIGLTRADIEWALSLPWHVDPTEALNDRLRCRRSAARWAQSGLSG